MSDRNIKTTFFTDASKNFVVNGSTRWYKYARNASMKSFDAMVQNIWGAGLCTIYDDDIGKLLYEFTREIGSNKVICSFDHEAIDNEAYTVITPIQFAEFTKKLSKSAKARKARKHKP